MADKIKISCEEFESTMKEVLKANPEIASSFEPEKFMGKSARKKFYESLRKEVEKHFKK